MIFKEERLRNEFWELVPKLRSILCRVEMIAKQHGEETVVTSLIRSQEEQKLLYDSGQAPSLSSVHMYGRGGDVRKFKSPALNQVIVQTILDEYPYGHLGKPSAMLHEGSAEHLHFQCWEMS